MTGHLIHIGYPKTGSTFLKLWFERHPQLQFVDGGIAGFRDVHDIARQGADPLPDMLYRVTSSEALATPHAYAGETVIDYLPLGQSDLPAQQAAACDLLAGLFPEAHVLLVTRGFRSVLVSAYSQYARTGGTEDFGAFVAPPLDGPDRSVEAWDYDRLVGLYRRRFAERLIILPFELLRDDPDHFVRELEQRLGLDHCPAPRARLNPALAAGEVRWYPRLTRLALRLPFGRRVGVRVTRLYGRPGFARPLRLLIRLLQRIRPMAPLTPESLAADIVERFRGRADCLKADPLYAAYAEDYLF